MNPDSTNGFHLGYRPWLDGMRGIAIILVLLFHLQFLAGGFLGVDIFFVLSGFLITSLLMEEWHKNGKISLKKFYTRRALRLFPALGVLLLLLAGYSFFIAPPEAAIVRKEILVTACYLSDFQWWLGVQMPHLGPTWSLSIEEQFYLLWPLVLIFMMKKGFSRASIISLLVFVIIAVAAIRRLMWGHGFVIQAYMALFTRTDSLLAGCLVGLLMAWNLIPKSRRFVTWASIAMAVSAIVLGVFISRYGVDRSMYYRMTFTIVALMVAVIIIRLLIAPARWVTAILEFKPLVGIGRISYALYLYQFPVMHWIKPDPASPWGLRWESALAVSLTFAAAIASYYLIERPALRLKARFKQVNDAPSQMVSRPVAAVAPKAPPVVPA